MDLTFFPFPSSFYCGPNKSLTRKKGGKKREGEKGGWSEKLLFSRFLIFNAKVEKGLVGVFFAFSLPLGSTYCWLANVTSFFARICPSFCAIKSQKHKKITCRKKRTRPILVPSCGGGRKRQIEQCKSHI